MDRTARQIQRVNGNIGQRCINALDTLISAQTAIENFPVERTDSQRAKAEIIVGAILNLRLTIDVFFEDEMNIVTEGEL